MGDALKAPFPYFGGKATIAPVIWEALGNPPNYVEPFGGSLAVLLGRPHAPGLETCNDADGLVQNFWRAVQAAPEAVAAHADYPSHECTLHARHVWLVQQKETLQARLEGNPEFYDAKIAGWWVWGMACWIGSGFCAGEGPWQVVDGQLVRVADGETGVKRKLTHLGNAGRGVQRQLTHLSNAGQGVQRQLTHLSDAGQGVQCQLTHLSDAGRGVQRKRLHLGGQSVAGGVGVQSAAASGDGLVTWMQALCDRLRRVRLTCGDWTRVLGPSVTYKHGLTGVYLDPPYSHRLRATGLYRVEADIAAAVQAWCLANGDNPLMRIVLSGYEGEYDLPGWRVVQWKAQGGMSNQNRDRDNQNKYLERLWISPHCVETQLQLFA